MIGVYVNTSSNLLFVSLRYADPASSAIIFEFVVAITTIRVDFVSNSRINSGIRVDSSHPGIALGAPWCSVVVPLQSCRSTGKRIVASAGLPFYTAQLVV